MVSILHGGNYTIRYTTPAGAKKEITGLVIKLSGTEADVRQDRTGSVVKIRRIEVTSATLNKNK